MDLRAAAVKPKLQKLTLDSEYVTAEYGEPLDFYMWDRQSMPTYINLSTISNDDTAGMLDAIRGLVMDEHGALMLEDGMELPPQVMIDMINKVVEHLGNSVGQTLAG